MRMKNSHYRMTSIVLAEASAATPLHDDAVAGDDEDEKNFDEEDDYSELAAMISPASNKNVDDSIDGASFRLSKVAKMGWFG